MTKITCVENFNIDNLEKLVKYKSHFIKLLTDDSDDIYSQFKLYEKYLNNSVNGSVIVDYYQAFLTSYQLF